MNPMTVKRDRGFLQDIAQALLQRVLMNDDLPVFKKGLIGRIYNDRAAETIEQRVLPGLQGTAGIFEPNHRWNPERARHDRRVRSLAADVRSETEHVPFVQLGRIRRGEIVADDDARLLQMTGVHAGLEAKQ